ncbi:hypothetical protein GEMRC1_005569 [Eukaryota sp. GEM-RC1]
MADSYPDIWADAVMAAYAEVKLSNVSTKFLTTSLLIFQVSSLHKQLYDDKTTFTSHSLNLAVSDSNLSLLQELSTSSSTLLKDLNTLVASTSDLLSSTDVDVKGVLPALSDLHNVLCSVSSSWNSSFPDMSTHATALHNLMSDLLAIRHTLLELSDQISTASKLVKEDLSLSLLLSQKSTDS